MIQTSLGSFRLHETVAYPNGGHTYIYVCGEVALIVDDGICAREAGQPVFDYSLITNKQNAYVASYERVFRFLRKDLDENPGEVERFLRPGVDVEMQEGVPLRQSADRANVASASPLEIRFEEHFANVYGADSARYLWREYAVTDLDGHVRYVDYVVRTKHGLLGVEENGVSYHHPQIIGVRRWRDQLLKQNSCQLAGIRLFRFSSEDCRFAERLEDDIRSYFGATSSSFLDAGMVVERPFELYEHQGDALAEMERRRKEGTRSFLAVFPTASGKSQIVLEDLARFASALPGCRSLVMAPTRAIVDDWRRRVRNSLPALEHDVYVCTYGHINRHYTEFDPAHFDYVVVDEAHHAVAPALKRTIQHFDPAFLVGLTATDQRPDKRRLEEVFGSYRVGLSLADAMERGIVATARAFRIETNVDLSHVRINGKDYVNADLEKRVRVTSRNELIVDVLQRYFCPDKTHVAKTDRDASRLQGVIFCVNVRHTKEMERLLRDAGIPARALNGSTPHPERVMDDFRAGRIRFLCSCQMISEGWDYPELGILVMARPTLSRVLYLQQLGRGLRRTPSKRDVFVIDVVDEYGTMAAPCSLHTVFQNPYYVPFGDILRRDYEGSGWRSTASTRESSESSR